MSSNKTKRCRNRYDPDVCMLGPRVEALEEELDKTKKSYRCPVCNGEMAPFGKWGKWCPNCAMKTKEKALEEIIEILAEEITNPHNSSKTSANLANARVIAEEAIHPGRSNNVNSFPLS